ncbi:MAG: hypothetical protein LC808_42105, partial [Actinobacteria bacterium]|nr:hypothetical protein [Actinomycetota bacterium]
PRPARASTVTLTVGHGLWHRIATEVLEKLRRGRAALPKSNPRRTTTRQEDQRDVAFCQWQIGDGAGVRSWYWL